MNPTSSSRRLKATVARQDLIGNVIKPVLEGLEQRLMFSTHRHTTSAVLQEITGGTIRISGGTPTGTTPAQISHLYQLDSLDTPNRNFPLYLNRGDNQTIVIIGSAAPQLNDRPAPLSPSRLSNINLFSAQYNLHSASVFEDPIQSVLDEGYVPNDVTANQNFPFDDVSARVTEMQIEWAHAMAPFANLILVEVPSVNGEITPTDLQSGIEEGVQDLQEVGDESQIGSSSPGGVLLMGLSTQGENPTTEAQFDSLFSYKYAANVSFIAPAGEVGGLPSMPSSSPWVTSVGGTVYNIDSAGNRISETASLNAGGGKSLYETLPAFQQGLKANGTALTTRSLPDLSLASTQAGQGLSFIYDQTPGATAPIKWYTYDGTTGSAAIFAGMVADANELRRSVGQAAVGRALNTQLYSLFNSKSSSSYFTDITEGSNTLYPAVKGYDLATGMGVPDAYNLIPALSGLSNHITSKGGVATQSIGVNFNGDLTAALTTGLTGNAVAPFTQGSGTLLIGATSAVLSFSATSTVSNTTAGVTTTSVLVATLTSATLQRNLTTGAISGTGTVTISGAEGETFNVAITGTLRSSNGRYRVSGTLFTVNSRGKRVPQGAQDVFAGDFSS